MKKIMKNVGKVSGVVDNSSKSKSGLITVVRHTHDVDVPSVPKLLEFGYNVQFGLPVCGKIMAVDRNEAMLKLKAEIGSFESVDITMNG